MGKAHALLLQALSSSIGVTYPRTAVGVGGISSYQFSQDEHGRFMTRCLGQDLPVTHCSMKSEVIWSQQRRVINGEEEQLIRISIAYLEEVLGE